MVSPRRSEVFRLVKLCLRFTFFDQQSDASFYDRTNNQETPLLDIRSVQSDGEPGLLYTNISQVSYTVESCPGDHSLFSVTSYDTMVNVSRKEHADKRLEKNKFIFYYPR